ncbi:hypothetical protein WJX73_010645 [Symbiochloris irregularis]|uniref:USP domain-containing protein n=1 Tax=Symbiochloris irregularis TaxID=706552 RepID=A0AAW1PL82_9CHLO
MAKGKRHKNHRQQQRSSDRARKADIARPVATGSEAPTVADSPAAARPGISTPASGQPVATAAVPPGNERVLGFGNLGNTCFFNSGVQVLTAAPPLIEAYCQQLDVELGPLGGALQHLLQTVHEPNAQAVETGKTAGKSSGQRSSSNVFIPRRLHTAICKAVPRFKGGRQQDSHELMRCLLNGIQAEDEAIARRTPLSEGAEEQQSDSAAQAPIKRLFEGQLGSQMRCCHCQHMHTVPEPFLDLSLPIPTTSPLVTGDTATSSRDARGQPGKVRKGKGVAKAAEEATGSTGPAAAASTAKQRRKDLQKARRSAEKERRKQRRAPSSEASVHATPENGAAEEGVGEEIMVGLGDLFDDSTAYSEARPSSNGANDTAWIDSEEEPDQASHSATLQGCLAAFFATEKVQWECPAEAEERKNRRATTRTSSFASTAQSQGIRERRRAVSFSGQKPGVRSIPGSVEARGTNMHEALQGRASFCRPMRHKGASLLMTATADPLSRDRLVLSLAPHDYDDATTSVLMDTLRGPSVSIGSIEDSDNEDEQSFVAAQASALMDCAADMVRQHGLEAFRQMQEVRLQVEGDQTQRSFQISGQLPGDLGGGLWQYPGAPETPTSPTKDLKSSRTSSPFHTTMEDVPLDAAPDGPRTADKGYCITSAPQLLMLHLKRFRQDARGRLVKVSGHVAFDFNLDLAPYFDAQNASAEHAKYALS